MKYKKIILILFFLILLPICFATTKFDNTYFNNYWYKFYNPDIEMGGCGEIRVIIQNNTITNYTWHLANMYQYGNTKYVYVKCSKVYDTMVHSHPRNSICEFSDIDYNSMKVFKYSVLYCEHNIRIGYRDYKGNIYEGIFNE